MTVSKLSVQTEIHKTGKKYNSTNICSFSKRIWVMHGGQKENSY